MATLPRLVMRGRTFYFRASVPQDLWDVAGRKEVKISLRTAVRSLALMRCRTISTHVDLVVAQARGMARGMAQGQDAAIDQAVRRYFSEALDWGQEFADIFAPEAEVDVDDCIATLETRLALLRRRLAVKDFPSDIQSDATALVGAIPPDTLTSRFQALQRAQTGLLRAKIEADRLLLAKLHGDYAQTQIADPLFAGVMPSSDAVIPAIVTPSPLPTPPAVAPAPPLRELATKYEQALATQNIKEKTLGDLRLTFDLARAVIDFDKPASLLDTADMKALRDLIGQIPAHYQKKPETRDLDPVAAIKAGHDLPKMGYETQKKRFDFFKRFVAWMVAEEYLPKVPGADLKLLVKKPPKGKPKRLPYDAEQLKLIFTTPIYTGRRSVKHSGVPGDLRLKDGRYWVPVIALYAGMRSGEIIQLLKSDIRTEDGVTYFDISKWEEEEAEEIKNLKTGSSYRRVPIHSAILSLGFLDYVTSRGSGRIFPDLKLGSDGTYSQPWSKFWYNLGNAWGFRTPLHVFHSFRHNFVDALHDANVTDAIAMQLCGHADDAAHWGYGKGASLGRLKEEIEKVQYAVSIPGDDW